MKENQKGAGRFTVPWTAPLQKQKEGNAVYLTKGTAQIRAEMHAKDFSKFN